MSQLTDTLVSLFSGAIESAGESELVKLLQQLHDKEPEVYTAVIAGFNLGVSKLKTYAAGTSTKIDDMVLDTISEAISASVAANPVSTVTAAVASETDPPIGDRPTNPA